MMETKKQSPAQLEQALREKTREVDVLHRISDSISNTLDLQAVLKHIVDVVVEVTKADACLLYLLSDRRDELILRASKNPHPKLIGRITIGMGEGITGWVAAHRSVVALSSNAAADARFKLFQTLPEDMYEAFLSVPVRSRSKLVGVINVQHRQPHTHSRREVQLISMLGFLVGAIPAKDAQRLSESNWHRQEALHLAPPPCAHDRLGRNEHQFKSFMR